MNNSKKSNIADDIDVNNPDFYASVQNETECDKAKLLKTLEIISTLRLEAAELEVETAASYHAELWHAIGELKSEIDRK